MSWWVWLVVVLIAAVIEVAGSGLVFIGIAAAALVTALVALFIPSFPFQAVVFVAATALYLFLLRPTVIALVSGRRSTGGSISPGVALAGKRAIVSQVVTEDGGQIRVGQGEFWSARLYSAGESIPIGTRVDIVLVDGLVALVAPMELPSPVGTSHSSSST